MSILDTTMCVYVHINKYNGKMYIGKTVQPLKRRMRKNFEGYKSCTVFYRAIQKYGPDAFETRILEIVGNVDKLTEREMFYIEKYDTMAPVGYNTVDYENGLAVFPQFLKDKISESRKKYYANLTYKIIAPNRKEHIYVYGYPHKQCSDCNQVLPLDDYNKCKQSWDKKMRVCKVCQSETNKKNRKAILNEEQLKLSYEKRSIQISNSLKNRFSADLELKARISKAKKEPLMAYNPETNEKLIFESAIDAKGFNNKNISKALKSGKKYRGYIWSKLPKFEEIQNIADYIIFECEKQNPVKLKIWESIINKNKATVIYARKCDIREVSSKDQTKFLEENHLQGNYLSKVRYGLYFEDELVAFMSFSKPRYDKSAQWELIRFCNKLNTRVVGGASKLLKHFIKTHNPDNIISYANKRFSKGALYEALGFTKVSETFKDYYYEKDGVLNHRTKFQKHKLPKLLKTFDINLTEIQNMKNNGYNMVEGPGSIKYILTISS